MTWLFAVLAIAIVSFGFVVFFGAPYLPTLSKQQGQALDLLDLKPGQIMLELGSGDGRMLKAAAQKGIISIGYELNPLLVIFSYLATFKYRRLIRIRWANFWAKSLPDCDGIYVFLLDKYMTRLDKKITQEIPSSVKVVSFAFKIPGRRPTTEVEGLFLYNFTTGKRA